MREFLLITVLVSGGVTLIGIYSLLEYSKGVAKSELERATMVVNAVAQKGESPTLTYWVNVFYLKLVGRFRVFLGFFFVIFIFSFSMLLSL